MRAEPLPQPQPVQPITQAPLKAPETPSSSSGTPAAGLGDHRQADERRPLPRHPSACGPGNQSAACRFVARMQDAAGLHELTLRSSVKWDLGNRRGRSAIRLPDGSTEISLSSSSSKTAPRSSCAYSRVSWPGFRDRSVCDRYIAGKDDFRVGNSACASNRRILRARIQTVASGAGACRRAVRRSAKGSLMSR